jgi:hypothetical protein
MLNAMQVAPSYSRIMPAVVHMRTAIRHRFAASVLGDRDLVAPYVARSVLWPRHIEVTIRDPDPASLT